MRILLCVIILLIQKYFAFNFLFESLKALPVQYSRLHTVWNAAELYTNSHFFQPVLLFVYAHIIPHQMSRLCVTATAHNGTAH